jgi:HAD superfamily hydrolase (TIGR01509 family)
MAAVQRVRDGWAQLIIFDFDGVVADSELAANRLLAEALTGIGSATSAEEAIRLYMGRRWADCVPLMESRLGGPLPEGFLAEHAVVADAKVVAEIQPIAGVQGFLERFAHVPRCIASSSRLDYIARCLDRMALGHWFEHRFSAQGMARGKPHPDLFLKAAATLGVEPYACAVIEDSPMGVMAGKAAGMLTIGLCAGGHILDGHAEALVEAGADHVVHSYADVARLLEG